MDNDVLDTTGLVCPKPVIELSIKSVTIREGTVLDVLGDCSTFEVDMKKWCNKSGKTMLSVIQQDDGVVKCTIQF